MANTEEKPVSWGSRAAFALTAVGGLAGYLAVVGGVLLYLRFRHAGLPTTQALAAVPTAQMVTTAFVEILAQSIVVLVLLGLVALFGLYAASRAPADPSLQVKPRDTSLLARLGGYAYRLTVVGVIIVVAFALPTDVYGLASALSFVSPLAIAFAGGRIVKHVSSAQKAMAYYVLASALLAALPVFARQLVGPLNMETVRVERAGKAPVEGGLVALRDGSVVMDRCRKLIVVPFSEDARVTVIDRPDGGAGARSLADRLGIRRDEKQEQSVDACSVPRERARRTPKSGSPQTPKQRAPEAPRRGASNVRHGS